MMKLLLTSLTLGALGACVPPSSLPAPMPLPDGASRQAGVAVAGVGHEIDLDLDPGWIVLPQRYGQLYGRVELGERFTLSGQLWGGGWAYLTQSREGSGESSLSWFPELGLGAELRFAAFQSELYAVGLSAGGGTLYARAGVPLAVSAALLLGEGRWSRVWIGAHPSLGAAVEYYNPTLQLPLVLAWQGEEVQVYGELAILGYAGDAWYPRLGLSIARSWGPR